MKDLAYCIDIAAPVARVWAAMLGAEGYRHWTAAFCEGSYFEGSWAQGGTIRFLSPDATGMQAEVLEHRPHERIVLRHVAELRHGEPLPDSPLTRQTPLEAYHFRPRADGGTTLEVRLQGWDSFLDFLDATWPKALQRLKALAESPP